MEPALEEVATAAEEVARDEREVARRARAMQRKRERGWTWARILDDDAQPSVVELVRRSAQRATEAKTRLSTVLARELSAEGLSRRQLARLLQVTHQRVSALLHRDGSTASE
jgi:predicted XRE-type DNA-binding protein